MALTDPEREHDTRYLRLFQEFHPEIQSLFRSTLGIKILFILKDEPGGLAYLREATGGSVPALLAKNNTFIADGLVEKVQNDYALTNSARIIVSQMIGMMAEPEMPRCCGGQIRPGRNPDESRIDKVMANWATIQTLYRSGIIAGILLALSGGEKTRSELRAIFASTSNALIPRIRWLEGMGLIRENRHDYALTSAGERVALRMEQFIATFAAVIRHRYFWNSHCLERLPDCALDSFEDLADAEIICDNPTNYLLHYEHYLALLAEAGRIRILSSMANPSITDAIGARVAAGVPVELIVSPELACELHQAPYREKIASLSTYQHLQFRVTELPIPMGLTITDRCLSIRLFVRDGITYDMQNGLFCTSAKARLWGERLFEYYRERSVPMAEYICPLRWT